MTEQEYKKKAKEYANKIEEKWNSATRVGYLCYESYGELIGEFVWKVFGIDIFNDVESGYKVIEDTEERNIIRVIIRLEEELCFYFDMKTTYGVDIPQHIDNGHFCKYAEIPKDYKDVWELLPNEE